MREIFQSLSLWLPLPGQEDHKWESVNFNLNSVVKWALQIDSMKMFKQLCYVLFQAGADNVKALSKQTLELEIECKRLHVHPSIFLYCLIRLRGVHRNGRTKNICKVKDCKESAHRNTRLLTSEFYAKKKKNCIAVWELSSAHGSPEDCSEGQEFSGIAKTPRCSLNIYEMYMRFICIALCFYATAAFLHSVGDTHHLSKNMVCSAIHQVSHALTDLLGGFVFFPGHFGTLWHCRNVRH